VVSQRNFFDPSSAPQTDDSTFLPQSVSIESHAVEAPSEEELLSVETERIDDIPLLVKTLEQMGIPQIIDTAVHPHGNRCGLSVGWLTTTWLTYILSESDHRMCEVEGWAENRIQTLNGLLPDSVTPKDFTDDRLASVLHDLSDNSSWQSIEHATGQRLIRVYHLPEDTVRLDSTTVSVYHDTEDTELFRLGHSKDHRPDLPQFKVMLATMCQKPPTGASDGGLPNSSGFLLSTRWISLAWKRMGPCTGVRLGAETRSVIGQDCIANWNQRRDNPSGGRNASAVAWKVALAMGNLPLVRPTQRPSVYQVP